LTGFDTYFIGTTGNMETLDTLAEGMKKLNDKAQGYLWLDYYEPTQENLDLLTEPFKIHALSLEDCLDDDQIPKINEYETYLQVLFNTFLYSDKVVLINEINLFVGENFLVTVTRAEKNNPDVVKEFKVVIEREMRNAKLGPSYAMHEILDHIVDDKFTAIEAVGDNLAYLEDVMTENHSDFDHALLQKIRQSLMSLRKSLFHEREILVKICRNDIALIPDKAIIHYNDIYDHVTKFFEITEIYREMVTNLIQTNLAIINNDIAISANATNNSVKRLTVITTVFMPLTLLSGIFGMSEWSMITSRFSWKVSYPAFFGLMIVIGIADYFLIKWLERNDDKH